jgi:hypothetical protein
VATADPVLTAMNIELLLLLLCDPLPLRGLCFLFVSPFVCLVHRNWPVMIPIRRLHAPAPGFDGLTSGGVCEVLRVLLKGIWRAIAIALHVF